jgi:hypothetical protein
MGGFTADQNLVLKGGGYSGNPLQVHVQQFDVYGDQNCPAFVRGLYNCGNSGEQYQITNNAFQFTTANSFLLRGSPVERCLRGRLRVCTEEPWRRSRNCRIWHVWPGRRPKQQNWSG